MLPNRAPIEPLTLETIVNRAVRALVSLAACVAAFSLAAETQTSVVDARQDRQASRIAKAQATGQLSNQEAARLNAGQRKVSGMKAGAVADGKVTRAERAAIQKAQNKQSRRIKKQKYDGNNE